MVESEVEITHELVREIAGNLGASEKLTEALIEKMFVLPVTGTPFTPCPRKRDLAVLLVAKELDCMWGGLR